ncbi:MAG: helix-turn-helix domain-containing protein [Candidatus Thermoplasmatota archaeon]|nr:helix-turn-helix domain-containing protein [Candidatus Thermoplasmatota archaeon]
MTKVSLDIESFKALASETRLDILRALDGKKMNLTDICHATNLHKMTLHEHLSKLTEAGFINRIEREGHKWVYYKLSWKGESLLHPENTHIVVLFSFTFFIFFLGIVAIVNFIKQQAPNPEPGMLMSPAPSAPSPFLYISVGCFVVFSILCSVSLWRYSKNRTPRL